MRLKESTSIFNMGDTSIRVKEVVPIYKQILKTLQKHNQSNQKWNNESQASFYSSVLSDFAKAETEDGINLFGNLNRNEITGLDKRGRTLTNALVKICFINYDRKLSQVGLNYISETEQAFDKLEELFGLTIDNLVYFRQLLKLRIYDSNSDKYFYNFRFALAFLNRYSKVPVRDFLWIVESIKPNFSEEKIKVIIDNYQSVYDNNKTFEQYRDEEFANHILIPERVDEARKMFSIKNFSDENFKKLFPNRKNSNKSLEYKSFVLSIINFTEEKTERSFEEMMSLSKQDAIKKAFGDGKAVFKYKNKDSIQDFITKNSDNPLLSGQYLDIYYAFTWSKHNDLIKEYSDMCKRIFSLSGVISFNQGIVSLGRPWIFPKLFSLLNGNFKISGEASYEEYENDIKSSFYQDICISDILELSYTQVLEIQNQIAEEFGIADISNIKQFVADKQEREFREFVEQEFGITKVSEVLSFISQRNDKKVQELVTDNALVPTIFEYILAIAWYYISDKKFQLRKSMQLTFSADNLPLSHAGGNKGDIEIEYSDKMLLLEATLMDKSTQKRGELEPVIRHSVNLALSTNKPLQTIFVANEVDDNVVNIFRATSFIQLNGTLTKGSVKGLNIFALTIPEIINILDRKINEQRIFEKLDDFSTIEPYRIENGWREEIVSEILA